MLLVPDDYEHLYILTEVDVDNGKRGMATSEDGLLFPVDSLPDGSSGGSNASLLGYFVGLWQTVKDPEDRSSPCVYIREDGSYTTVNKDGEVVAQGKIEPGENRQVVINADGTGDEAWTLMEEGALSDSGDTAMIRLNGNGLPDAEAMADIVGNYANWDFDKVLTICEDGTWMIRDKLGNVLESGVMSQDIIDDGNSDVDFILIPDSEGYPIILDDSYNDQYRAYDLVRLPNEEIPELMKYVGLWKWDYKDKTALVKLSVYGYSETDGLALEGAEVDENGNVVSDFDYLLYVSSDGKLLMEGDGDYGDYLGFRYAMHEDSDGCLYNLQGEKILTPVN